MNRTNFKKQKNLLKDLILRESTKEYSKQTIIGLFRSILEPVVEAQNQDSLVLLRLKNTENINSVIKRLEYTTVKLCFFSDEQIDSNLENVQKEKCWENVEFVVVLAPRYSAVFLWDYSLADLDGVASVYLQYNSRGIADIAKIIFENSNVDLERYLTDFAPDRRENELLNTAINKIADAFNSVNEENRITEAEKETLTKTEDKLQEYEYTSDKAKIVSHEIKNHISIIDLYSKIIEKRIENNLTDKKIEESSLNAVKNIKKSSHSICQLLNELKTFAKLILVERRLSSIIPEAVELALPKAKEKNIRLDYSIETDYRVHIDEIKIQSVLINVIYNAIESIKNKGEVTVKCDVKKNNYARIIIKDNGEGIKKDLQDKIFEFGFTTKIDGNGLGLYICKSLMKEQYGDINIVKSDENGTELEILIPII